MAEEKELLVPLENYLASGVHIGTKQRVGAMKKFVYKIRPDGLCIFDIQKIDERIRVAANFLARYEPDKILVVCCREVGRKACKKFGEVTNIKVVVDRFMPGTLTNPHLSCHIEPEIIVVTDPSVDYRAIEEALKMRIPIIAFCDTNNMADNIDLIIPANNKSKKSLALLYYLLAREYLKIRGINAEIKLEDFMDK